MERPAVIVALALSPSLDVTYEVDELRRGEITRPRTVTRVAGGKALNVARVARALGAEVRVVAPLGGHTGERIAELLAADGVPAEIVRLERETRVCSAIVESDGPGSSTDLYEPATSLSAAEWRAFRRAADLAGEKDGTWIVLSGSLPGGVPPDEAVDLLDALRAARCRVAVDSSGPALRALAGHADLLKVNRAEAVDLIGDSAPDARSAATSLRARWGCDAIVTDGVRGGFAIVGDLELSIAPPGDPGRFSAGSGDAFLGGYLAGLDAHLEVPAALGLARYAAERNALIAGQGVMG